MKTYIELENIANEIENLSWLEKDKLFQMLIDRGSLYTKTNKLLDHQYDQGREDGITEERQRLRLRALRGQQLFADEEVRTADYMAVRSHR